jgi:hypothetical protein
VQSNPGQRRQENQCLLGRAPKTWFSSPACPAFAAATRPPVSERALPKFRTDAQAETVQVFDLRRRGSRPANAGAEAPDNPSGLSASQPVVLSPTNAIISLCLTTLTLPWIIEVTAIGPSLGSEIGAWAVGHMRAVRFRSRVEDLHHSVRGSKGS